jgi:hypothetical protein
MARANNSGRVSLLELLPRLQAAQRAATASRPPAWVTPPSPTIIHWAPGFFASRLRSRAPAVFRPQAAPTLRLQPPCFGSAALIPVGTI